MQNDYSKANSSLTEKASQTENARERAQQLLYRATVLTVDTATKFEKLQSIDQMYRSQNSELGTLQDRVNTLKRELEYYVQNIHERSEFYRNCQP